jgi:hypothetical protein
MRIGLAWIIVMVLLSACIPAPQRSAVPPQISEEERPALRPAAVSETERLLEQFAVIRALPREQVAKEYADASRELSQTPTVGNRVKIAWLLGLSGTGFQDLNRSVGLLQEALKDEAPETVGVRRLAALLFGQFSRDQRQEEMIQSLNQRLREESKRAETAALKPDDASAALAAKLKEDQKRIETLQAKQEENTQTINQLTQKLKEEKGRADLLQQKLDALANIEKAIVDRQQQNKPETKK